MLLYLGNWGYFHFTLPQGLNIVGAWARIYQCASRVAVDVNYNDRGLRDESFYVTRSC